MVFATTSNYNKCMSFRKEKTSALIWTSFGPYLVLSNDLEQLNIWVYRSEFGIVYLLYAT